MNDLLSASGRRRKLSAGVFNTQPAFDDDLHDFDIHENEFNAGRHDL